VYNKFIGFNKLIILNFKYNKILEIKERKLDNLENNIKILIIRFNNKIK